MFNFVEEYTKEIKNGRTLHDIFMHLVSEAEELDTELDAWVISAPAGKDGVVGEAIDIILCALDLIHKHSPHLSHEQIDAIAKAKCEKWKRRYSGSVRGDRSVD